MLNSKAWGHEGGDLVTAEFKNPGVANSPLSVVVTGNDIVVNLATNGVGRAHEHGRAGRSPRSTPAPRHPRW